MINTNSIQQFNATNQYTLNTNHIQTQYNKSLQLHYTFNKFNTQSIHIQYTIDTHSMQNSIIPYKSNTKSKQNNQYDIQYTIHYEFNTHSTQIQCNTNTNSIHTPLHCKFNAQFNANSIHIQYKSNTNSIPIQCTFNP